MNYEESIEYIESLSPTLVRPGLERFDLFMQEHGSLQDRYQSLHVAGTNGKGSVVCMLAESFKQSGLSCGRYTGPHLLTYNERVEVSGALINNEEFAELCSRLRKLSEEFGKRHPEHGSLTWFELLTAIAFFYFADKKVEMGVFEVGLGGQFDATTVLHQPVVTAIVSISLDHTHILGSTIEEIAREKAGILKNEVPLVTGCTGAALEVIVEEAKRKNVPVICVNEKAGLRAGRGIEEEFALIREIEARIRLPRAPKEAGAATNVVESILKRQGYQRHNAAVAAVTLAVWELKSKGSCLDAFDTALGCYFWPGRMQFFEKQNLILDGAHNEGGAKALRESLDELFPNKATCFILSFYQSKQFERILTALIKPGDWVFCSEAAGKRPVVAAAKIVDKAEELGAKATQFSSIQEAFVQAEKEFPELIRVGTGSFATVSAGLKFLGFHKTVEAQFNGKNI